MYFDDTDLPWIAPSPNLPTVSSAVVYPGQVIFEGTNISEGRGTTQPFELFGAPYMEPDRLLEHLPAEATEGIHLRHHSFEPTSNKWSGTVCNGFQLHITDLKRYAPYKSSLAFLQSIIKTSADQFLWKKPPYEYEYHKLPIDLIIGDQTIREQIESGVDISMIEASWLDELNRFNSLKQKFHLYT